MESAITNLTFAPITVDRGTTVVWVNRDPLQHDVTADDSSFTSPALNQNQSFEFRFDRPGTFAFSCTFHPTMRATVTVR